MDIFAAVRLRAVSERPYFASALFAMTIIKKPGLETFAIDKYGRVYVDPDIVGKGKQKNGKPQWTVEQAAHAFIHEVGHWLRKHHERAEPIVKAAECAHCASLLCNLAEDAALNCEDDIARKLPGDCVTVESLSEQFKVKLDPHDMWENYYEKLKKPFEKSLKPSKDGSGHPHPGGPDCGSGADGRPRPWDEGPPGGKNPDGKESPEGIRDAEGDMLRKGVAREIRDAASKNRGTVPAGWVRWADSLLQPPQVAWEKELSALIRQAITMAMGCVDYCYSKPNRRGMFAGVIMPSLRRPKPEAAVVIDTSGSMGKYDLSACLAEVEGILKAVGQRMVPVICCDAAAAPVQRVSKAFSIELIGGGGTDMGVGIAAAEQLGSEVIIVLTDGYTPWPAAPPQKAQLVICIVGDDNQRNQDWQTPSYAKRVLHIARANTVAGDDDEAA